MFFSHKEEPLYIIGDVHGCAKSLHALIEQLPQKDKSHLVFVGDLIDRGCDSVVSLNMLKTVDMIALKAIMKLLWSKLMKQIICMIG